MLVKYALMSNSRAELHKYWRILDRSQAVKMWNAFAQHGTIGSAARRYHHARFVAGMPAFRACKRGGFAPIVAIGALPILSLRDAVAIAIDELIALTMFATAGESKSPRTCRGLFDV